MTVLIVEDNPSLARMYTKVLRHAGFETVVTPTIAEAIELFEAYAPPIICLDWRLEDDTADKFLDYLSQYPQAQLPKILVISAEVTARDIADYQEMIYGYYNKPVTLRDIVAELIDE